VPHVGHGRLTCSPEKVSADWCPAEQRKVDIHILYE